MMRFDILTLFPEMFQSPFSCSIVKKACEKGIISIHIHNIRDFALDKHRITDDYPYGGGGGMVMKVEPVAAALDSIPACGEGSLVVLLSPQGETFTQRIAEEFSACSRIVLLCGHYEGVDERIRNYLVTREISIGDFVLTGGELPAMLVLDAIARLVPGVLGNSGSAVSDSFSNGLLEGPQYTRPEVFRNWKVPEILLSGHHKMIERWRRKEALKRTAERRPDLLARHRLSGEDQVILAEIEAENKNSGS